MKNKLNDLLYSNEFTIYDLVNFINNNKDCKYLIKNKLFDIINSLKMDDINFFMIKDIDGFKEFINDNLIEILSYYMKDDISKICHILKDDLDIFINNLDLLYNELNFDEFSIILNFIKDKLSTKQLDMIYNDKHKIVSDLISYFTDEVKETDKEALIEVIIKLIDEICIYEKKTWKDINFEGFGCFSNVYSIGDKVIKLGSRLQFNIPYTKNLLKPLIRYNFEDICDGAFLVVEVTERLDTSEEISLNQMHDINLDMKKDNIIYNDMKPSNFGKLIKDNKIYWDKVLGDYNGIDGIDDNIILTKGSYVIADSDLLYKKK